MSIKKNRKPGRPSVFTDNVLDKLEEAFLLGCSDREACFLAGVSEAALYNYQKSHPEYLERKNALKDNVTIAARREVLEAIQNHDNVMTRWYLERKRPEEFTARQDIKLEAAGVLALEDREEALEAFLDRYREK